MMVQYVVAIDVKMQYAVLSPEIQGQFVSLRCWRAMRRDDG